MWHVRCTLHLVMKVIRKSGQLDIDNFQVSALEPAKIKWQKCQILNCRLTHILNGATKIWCKHLKQWPKSQISTTKKISHLPKKPSYMIIYIFFLLFFSHSRATIVFNHPIGFMMVGNGLMGYSLIGLLQTYNIQSMED